METFKKYHSIVSKGNKVPDGEFVADICVLLDAVEVDWITLYKLMDLELMIRTSKHAMDFRFASLFPSVFVKAIPKLKEVIKCERFVEFVGSEGSVQLLEVLFDDVRHETLFLASYYLNFTLIVEEKSQKRRLRINELPHVKIDASNSNLKRRYGYFLRKLISQCGREWKERADELQMQLCVMYCLRDFVRFISQVIKVLFRSESSERSPEFKDCLKCLEDLALTMSFYFAYTDETNTVKNSRLIYMTTNQLLDIFVAENVPVAFDTLHCFLKSIITLIRIKITKDESQLNYYLNDSFLGKILTKLFILSRIIPREKFLLSASSASVAELSYMRAYLLDLLELMRKFARGNPNNLADMRFFRYSVEYCNKMLNVLSPQSRAQIESEVACLYEFLCPVALEYLSATRAAIDKHPTRMRFHRLLFSEVLPNVMNEKKAYEFVKDGHFQSVLGAVRDLTSVAPLDEFAEFKLRGSLKLLRKVLTLSNFTSLQILEECPGCIETLLRSGQKLIAFGNDKLLSSLLKILSRLTEYPSVCVKVYSFNEEDYESIVTDLLNPLVKQCKEEFELDLAAIFSHFIAYTYYASDYYKLHTQIELMGQLKLVGEFAAVYSLEEIVELDYYFYGFKHLNYDFGTHEEAFVNGIKSKCLSFDTNRVHKYLDGLINYSTDKRWKALVCFCAMLKSGFLRMSLCQDTVRVAFELIRDTLLEWTEDGLEHALVSLWLLSKKPQFDTTKYLKQLFHEQLILPVAKGDTISVLCAGKKRMFHKNILSAVSPTLNALMFGDFMESRSDEIIFKEASDETLELLLLWLQLAHMQPSNEQVYQAFSEHIAKYNTRLLALLELWDYADQYLMDKLKFAVEVLIVSKWHKETPWSDEADCLKLDVDVYLWADVRLDRDERGLFEAWKGFLVCYLMNPRALLSSKTFTSEKHAREIILSNVNILFLQ